MAVLLRLSPDIAGITLLAFASGAPDIFTELAAINGGEFACLYPLFPAAVDNGQLTHAVVSSRGCTTCCFHATACCGPILVAN